MRQPQLELWPDPDPDPLERPIRIWDRMSEEQRRILVQTLARVIAQCLRPGAHAEGGEDSHE